MKEFDYTISARWFVTMCTYERKCILGKIVEGKEEPEMQLSEVGKIVEDCWLAIPNHCPNVILDEYVIMPNHIHGLLEIIDLSNLAGETRYANENNQDSCEGTACLQYDNPTLVGARHALPLPDEPNESKIAKSGKPIPGSLGIIIGSFKSAVTKRINELRNTQGKIFWQRNYWEHGIRTDRALDRIREYIKKNPLMWEDDEENILLSSPRHARQSSEFLSQKPL
jgi:putative transposase